MLFDELKRKHRFTDESNLTLEELKDHDLINSVRIWRLPELTAVEDQFG